MLGQKIRDYIDIKFEGKFDTSKIPEEIGGRERFSLSCPVHGDFQVTYESIQRSESGCRKCRVFERHNTQEENAARFLELLPEGNLLKFGYSKVSMPGNLKDKVKIDCLTCNREFEQRAQYHIGGGGCPHCSGRYETKETFVGKALKAYGDINDYSEFVYSGTYVQGVVRCVKHNFKYLISPMNHLSNRIGCPECSLETRKFLSSRRGRMHETFSIYNEEKLRRVHENKFVYSSAELSLVRSNKEYIHILCRKHGTFMQRLDSHGSGQGCPECHSTDSKGEREVLSFITSLGLDGVKAKGILKGQDIDIFIPSRNLGIEFNGLYHHSEACGRKSDYHINKTINARALGIRLIHIFEDEWKEKSDVVKSRLKSILGVDTLRHHARKLKVEKVRWKECAEFIDLHHMQGSGQATSVNYTLKTVGGEIVATMTFGISRFDKTKDIDLIRYCSKGTVVGGFSRLLSAYVKEYNPPKVISYADMRWSVGDVYLKNGFKLVSQSSPAYFWCKGQKRYNRVQFQKHKLEEKFEDFDPSKTEVELCEENGFNKVYDCGALKFELVP